MDLNTYYIQIQTRIYKRYIINFWLKHKPLDLIHAKWWVHNLICNLYTV